MTWAEFRAPTGAKPAIGDYRRLPLPPEVGQICATRCQDEDQDDVDQAGGLIWAAADLAQDLPALELSVRPLARAALAGIGGVDEFLAA